MNGSMTGKQNRRMSFRSHGPLMELTVICLFFIIAASVFILVFVRAGQLSSRAEDLSAAVNASQTIIESVIPEGGVPADGETSYDIYFDRDWKRMDQTSSAPSDAHAAAHVTETWTDGLVHLEVVVTSASSEDELYRLSTDRDFS